MVMLEKGVRVAEVARRVGVARGSVSRWKTAYEEAGEEGLKSKRHPGRKPKLSAKQREHLVKLLQKGPLWHGYRTVLWTLPRIAEVIEKHYGVRYHPAHVWRILRALGWSCQKPERRARDRDEEAIRRWRLDHWPHIKKRSKARP